MTFLFELMGGGGYRHKNLDIAIHSYFLGNRMDSINPWLTHLAFYVTIRIMDVYSKEAEENHLKELEILWCHRFFLDTMPEVCLLYP